MQSKGHTRIITVFIVISKLISVSIEKKKTRQRVLLVKPLLPSPPPLRIGSRTADESLRRDPSSVTTSPQGWRIRQGLSISVIRVAGTRNSSSDTREYSPCVMVQRQAGPSPPLPNLLPSWIGFIRRSSEADLDCGTPKKELRLYPRIDRRHQIFLES